MLEFFIKPSLNNRNLFIMNIDNFQKFSATGLKLLPGVLETRIVPRLPFKGIFNRWRKPLTIGAAITPVGGAAYLWDQQKKKTQIDSDNSSDAFNKIMQFADENPWAYYAAPAAALGGVGGLMGGSNGALAGLALGALGGYGLQYLRENPDVLNKFNKNV